MAIFLEILSILKLALEAYSAIKGAPNGQKDSVKAHLFDKVSEIKVATDAGAATGDYSALEAILNRPAS